MLRSRYIDVVCEIIRLMKFSLFLCYFSIGAFESYFAKLRVRLNRDHSYFSSLVNLLVDTILIHVISQQHPSTGCEC